MVFEGTRTVLPLGRALLDAEVDVGEVELVENGAYVFSRIYPRVREGVPAAELSEDRAVSLRTSSSSRGCSCFPQCTQRCLAPSESFLELGLKAPSGLASGLRAADACFITKKLKGQVYFGLRSSVRTEELISMGRVTSLLQSKKNYNRPTFFSLKATWP